MASPAQARFKPASGLGWAGLKRAGLGWALGFGPGPAHHYRGFVAFTSIGYQYLLIIYAIFTQESTTQHMPSPTVSNLLMERVVVCRNRNSRGHHRSLYTRNSWEKLCHVRATVWLRERNGFMRVWGASAVEGALFRLMWMDL
jgi:hypothetical protein